MRHWLLCAVLLAGCNKFYLTVEQEWIDRSYLASEHVNTPDPRRDDPPEGQKLVLSWRIPDALCAQEPKIALDVLFKDLTSARCDFPVKSAMGDVTYPLLNDAYREKQGFLAYRARVVTENGESHYLWQHQLWVELINLE